MILNDKVRVMNATSRTANPLRYLCAAIFIGLSFLPAISLAAAPPAGPPAAAAPGGSQSGPASVCEPATLGSPYIPVDSWVYPAVYRLYSLGFLDHVFLGMRPWTRASLSHMLENADAKIEDADSGPLTDQAREIYSALMHELASDIQGPCGVHQGQARIASVYTTFRGISGTPLDDSFHLGQSIINDYGRPFENGFNDYSGVSAYATAGRFAVYVRGEFQHAPSATGYSDALAQTLSQGIPRTGFAGDLIPFLNPATNLPYPQATIPLGPIASESNGRFLEAYVSYQVLNNILSLGKQDEWLGPAEGGSFAFSNNAQNFYSFQINRIEPLYIPLLSRLTGPFRYDFLVGGLRGHTYIPNPSFTGNTATQPNVSNPGDPWMHIEKISFKPTDNLEFGFSRTAIWGGKGHGPITIHTFLKSFFSFASPTVSVKYGRNDPGARFGSFDFTYRLPFVRNWLTLYSDGEVHDDLSPIDAPARAGWRPGLFLSHVPGVPRLSLRTEAVWTDPPVSSSSGGHFMYWETIQKQGYTNQGQIFGDWIGREGKGGQAWATYHLSGDEWIQAGWRHQKTAKDFIPGGTTLNDFNLQVVKRLGQNFAIDGNFKYEDWAAPIYLPGQQTVTATTVQLTWYPTRKQSF
jgi:Capsule assembly protein Wzi